MLSRRQVLYGGMGILASGVLPLGRRAAVRAGAPGDLPLRLGGAEPLAQIGQEFATVDVEGLPFMRGFTGDAFPNPHRFFPESGTWLANGRPPRPTESTDVVVIGGGISGLFSAYMLRDYKPIVLEHHRRFGGSATGESWGPLSYSLGGAYVITPDPGTFLADVYQELGLPDVVQVDFGQFEVESGGAIDKAFWDTSTMSPEDAAAFKAYAKVVAKYANEYYPDIPLPQDKDVQWILDLDFINLRDHIEQEMGMPMPTQLAQAVQAYCYSSFGRGAEEISAASGWNFLAAEEFGRWVFPGGNAYITQQLYDALSKLDGPDHFGLRSGCTVIDVRVVRDGVQVTYVDNYDTMRSILAKRVVMACSKHIVKNIVHDLDGLDRSKAGSIGSIETAAYLVANVLLEDPIDVDFYDIFLFGDDGLPMDPGSFQQNPVVTDVLNGHFAAKNPGDRRVLTLYWPLVWGTARGTLFDGFKTWRNYASHLAPQVYDILKLLGANPSLVQQVRMTYWGHAMPVAHPGFIAAGHAENVRRPIDDKIYFINQDNWALPAVENCLLDAEIFIPELVKGL